MSHVKVCSSAALGLALALLAAAPPAHAWEGQVTWTTWLRAGPGRDFAVIDEIWRGDAVQVQGCQNGWCQVMADSRPAWIEQDLLHQTVASPQPAPRTPGPGCFPGVQAGYGKGEAVIYCPGK